MRTQFGHRWPVVVGLLVGVLSGRGAIAQTVERDVTITGPRGNSIERQVKTERRGNVVDREINITRPGGTYHRETEVYSPRGSHARPVPLGGGSVYRGGGPRVVERDVFIGGPRPLVGPPSLNFFVGSAPPPPPIFFGPPAVGVGIALPPPAPLPPPRPSGVDQTADAIDELGSFFMKNRREGAITLGKLRDPRGVPPLVDRLKHDHEKEVRMAAAWALAEIGDPRGVVPLEVAVQFDKRPEVRAVAQKALDRMPPQGAPATSGTSARIEPQSARSSAVAPVEKGPASPLDDLPPPDPTPPGPRAEPGSGFGYPR